jgi:Dolichyl-phosphate-mannose-protein mannosyltransferase
VQVDIAATDRTCCRAGLLRLDVVPVTELQKRREKIPLARSMQSAPGRWLAIFSIVYLVAEICGNARRAFWLDELVTSYLADLPSFPRIWTLIAQGIELNPPLPFWITWAIHHTLGRGEFLTRLPAVLGFWLMCLCLYHFVRRRTDALHGFLALLFPLFTYTAWNANTARGYGLLLGFSGLALLCWQLATDGVRRPLALVGMAVAIAGAVSCHYYALYVAGALALGEAVRTLDRKRLDIAVWAALAAGISPMALYWPLFRAASQAMHTFWVHPSIESMYRSYADVLGPTAIILFLFLALAVWMPDLNRTEWRPATLRRHELVTILMLTAMPLAVYLSTFVAPVGFYTRYVQPVVLGATVLVAMFAYRIGGASDRFRKLWVTLLVWFCFLPWTLWQISKIFVTPQPEILHSLNIDREPNLPVVVDSDNDFLVSYHYAAPGVRARLYMLADVPSAVQYLGGDTSLRSLQLVQTFRDVHVVDYHRFIAAHREFFLARTEGASWIAQKLIADGAELRLVELKKDPGTFAEDNLLYRVTIGPGGTEPRP